jgi:hypothetical protein
MIKEVIKEKHDPVIISYPGDKRTQNFIALNFWRPGIRRSIWEYINACDAWQTRREDREFRTPIAEVEEPNSRRKRERKLQTKASRVVDNLLSIVQCVMLGKAFVSLILSNVSLRLPQNYQLVAGTKRVQHTRILQHYNSRKYRKLLLPQASN